LSITYVLARPLAAARLSPNAVTLLGMLVALTVPYLVHTDHLLLAGVMALVAGVIDNLDGAVAIMAGKSSDFGYVLDSVADRVGDVALLVGLGLAAASPWPALGAAFLSFLQEYTRARAYAVGFTERVLVVGMFLIATAVAGAIWATIGGWLALTVSILGLGQVLWAVRRRLV